jgi:hypothetical protein
MKRGILVFIVLLVLVSSVSAATSFVCESDVDCVFLTGNEVSCVSNLCESSTISVISYFYVKEPVVEKACRVEGCLQLAPEEFNFYDSVFRWLVFA